MGVKKDPNDKVITYVWSRSQHSPFPFFLANQAPTTEQNAQILEHKQIQAYNALIEHRNELNAFLTEILSLTIDQKEQALKDMHQHLIKYVDIIQDFLTAYQLPPSQHILEIREAVGKFRERCEKHAYQKISLTASSQLSIISVNTWDFKKEFLKNAEDADIIDSDQNAMKNYILHIDTILRNIRDKFQTFAESQREQSHLSAASSRPKTRATHPQEPENTQSKICTIL